MGATFCKHFSYSQLYSIWAKNDEKCLQNVSPTVVRNRRALRWLVWRSTTLRNSPARALRPHVPSCMVSLHPNDLKSVGPTGQLPLHPTQSNPHSRCARKRVHASFVTSLVHHRCNRAVVVAVTTVWPTLIVWRTRPSISPTAATPRGAHARRAFDLSRGKCEKALQYRG